ncbi:MAG: GNAT family N-acetyltransferase [Chloroflexaceae bacterium]|nr:GNAT family N-acetyltransferase [Chloroflexaceae bacterium]
MLLVGEYAGQPIGLVHLVSLHQGEYWCEGVRVAADYRGMGVGALLLQHGIALAQAQAARVLRLLTDETNTGMQQLVARMGFRECLRATSYVAPAMTDMLPTAQPLDRSWLPQLAQLVHDAPVMPYSQGLYLHDWRCYRLTVERLHWHLEQGDIVALPTYNGERAAAWAIAPAQRYPRPVCFVWGDMQPLAVLLRDLRCMQVPMTTKKNWMYPADVAVRMLLAEDSPAIPALLAAGFAHYAVGERCYELVFAEHAG